MAKPSIHEPADRDRLFVRPIINERARGLFGDNLQHIIEMSTEDRWRIAQSDSEAEDEDDAPPVPPEVREMFIAVMADVEAWIVVEQVRNAVRRPQQR